MGPAPRNIAIVLLLAAVVAFVPEAGFAAGFLSFLLSAGFMVALAWVLTVFYRQYKSDLLGLPTQWRGILYGAFGVMLLTLTATRELWDSGAGTAAWLALLAAASFAVYRVWLQQRAY